MGEMIMCDSILVDQKILDKIFEDSKLASSKKFKLHDLEHLGWVNKISNNVYILNVSLPGKIMNLTEEDSD